MKNSTLSLIFMFFLLVCTLSSCEDTFEYSVYSEHVDSNKQNTNQKNIQKLENTNQTTFSDFSVFLFSDTHLYYRELRQAIAKINYQKQNADFVIHCGDISNEGLFKEYEFTWDVMDKLQIPYLTVIGNHDLVANGREVYKKMFGKENYSFIYKNCKFVFFDDNIWENTVKEPDFEWLNNELQDETDSFTHTFVICHVPYGDEMFYASQKYVFRKIITASNVNLMIHGHWHNPEIRRDTLDNDKIIRHLITGSVRMHTIRRLDIKQDTVIINDIKF